MPAPTEESATRPASLDAPHGRAHSARMVVPFDTLAATEAMESVGLEPLHARAIAAQLYAVSRASDAVTRPELEAALATLKTELLDRIGELSDRITESERGLMDRIGELANRITESERGLVDRITESERGLVNRNSETERGIMGHITESQLKLVDRIDHIAENQRELADRIAERDRRYSAQIWRLFGGIAAIAGLVVSAIKYLP